jgi:uncharacterized protein with HEPN domain
LPFRDTNSSLRDIWDAANLIEDFVADLDFENFREDPKTVAAVERKLLIISEAAIRLGDEALVLCPGVAWADVRGIGNWLRHQYDAIELPVVWKTLRDDLPPLKAAVQQALQSLNRRA